MSYQVIARKWRPQNFQDLVGQEHVTTTLANAIKHDRVAHAYIFSGTRGVGKTTAARILAKALNCAKGSTPEPCGECDSCKEISSGTSLDVIEIDAASNRGIDQIRELREMVKYAPAASRTKVVILDEAHMLTGEASNALLKTLEEPPDRVVFVMATTQPEDLEETIRSRSQHFHFRALTFAEISGRLQEIAEKEDLQIEAGARAVIARMAEGSLRDALSLLEQARAFCGDKIPDKEVRELLGVVPEDALEELVQAIAEGSADRALGLVHTFQKEGRNLQHFCREAIRHMRNILIARVCGADSELIAATPDQRPALEKAASLFSEEDLTRFFQILLQTDDDLRRKPDPRVHLEMGLLRLINASRLAPLEELLAELKSSAPAGRNAGQERTAAPRQLTVGPRGTQILAPIAVEPVDQTKNPIRSVEATASALGSGASSQFFDPSHQESLAAVGPGSTPSLSPALVQKPEENPAKTNGSSASETGITKEQILKIKAAIQAQQKFLGELIDHGSRWELKGAELRIYFSPDKRPFAEMIEGRESIEKIRAISSQVLTRPVRVCVKLEASGVGAVPSTGTAATTQQMREQFERDPIVRSMLQRFGGKISEVKKRPN
jgi:DNA polymerase III subunit gamma/tau